MRRPRCSNVEVIRWETEMRSWCESGDNTNVSQWPDIPNEVHRSYTKIMWLVLFQSHIISPVPRSSDWSRAKVMWSSLVTMTLQMLSFLDANFVECVIICWEGILNENLVKNLPTNKLEWGEKLEDKWEHSSPVGKLMSLNSIMSLVKNLPTQWRKTEEKNRTRKSINKKSPKFDERMWEENQRYVMRGKIWSE